ncbi:MAG: hypothetical protein SWI22_07755 [Pseudomonadota bacterium]|nr:hypothetical protein [Pseudomonadota bacterium]
MIPTRLCLLTLFGLAACGPGESNSPTEPADPIDTPEAAAPPAAASPGMGSVMPGSGPRSFVGRWTADVAWCPNTTGPERPIEITTTRFEGYENSCAIASVDQIADGYDAVLTCTGEGTVSNERVRLSVSGQTLRLTWLNRDNALVTLTKCTTLEDTPAPGP